VVVVPRARTKKVLEVKKRLIARLESGYFSSGERFFSNRYVATHFNVSYKTAHTLLNELEEEGYLKRKGQSGSFVAGLQRSYQGVAIYAPRRIEDPASYSNFLFELLKGQLKKENLPYEVFIADCSTKLKEELYPIVIDLPCLQEQLYHLNSYGLFLNDKPQPGLSSILVDSIYCDNYSGGVAAAQLIQQTFGNAKSTIFAGPRNDWRGEARLKGFLSRIPDARVVFAETWHQEIAFKRLNLLFAEPVETLFCCNDKLAAAVVEYCEKAAFKRPPIIGFDNLPISEVLAFTSIGVPWQEVIEIAVKCAAGRLKQNGSAVRHTMVAIKPVLRGEFLKTEEENGRGK